MVKNVHFSLTSRSCLFIYDLESLYPWSCSFPSDLACKPTLASPQIESMEFDILVRILPPPPAAPITDYRISELLPIIIVRGS